MSPSCICLLLGNICFKYNEQNLLMLVSFMCKPLSACVHLISKTSYGAVCIISSPGPHICINISHTWQFGLYVERLILHQTRQVMKFSFFSVADVWTNNGDICMSSHKRRHGDNIAKLKTTQLSCILERAVKLLSGKNKIQQTRRINPAAELC